MRFARALGVVTAALLLPVLTRAAEPFHRPTQGNQFVSTTDKYLYVVWSVPKDLTPFAAIHASDELEAFIARTAVFLCHEHDAREPDHQKPCKVQVVRMNTNDEYTKSAAGGFQTIAEAVLPRERVTGARYQHTLGLGWPELKAAFQRFAVKHSRIQLPGLR